MSTINVSVDTSKLEKWALALSTRGLVNAIHRAVDRSATAARKVALKKIAADIGVSEVYIKDSVGKVNLLLRAAGHYCVARDHWSAFRTFCVSRRCGIGTGPPFF
ncbi:hypothetical protein ABIB06_004470 [Bradyrhizobium sp. LB8.2]|uniref:hypothetical protein n=1 Tax=unclassified Bradyrhizobium TaxID=2631580 RepID=UPI0033946E5C